MDQRHSPLPNAEVLAKARRLRFAARRIVEGLRVGTHRSRRHGSSVEFADHREYIPGDDLRHIDWKLLGKSDRYYVKRYQDETNLESWLILDCSASMAFKGLSEEGKSWWSFFGARRPARKKAAPSASMETISKHDHAVLIAAALAWMFIGQGDAVGLHCFGADGMPSIPPGAGRGRPHLLIEALAAVEAQGIQDPDQAIPFVANALRRRGVVIVLSDLLGETDKLLSALKQLRTRRNDVIVLHILHSHELELPYRDLTRFIDPEGDENEGIIVDPQTIRASYEEELRGFLEQTRRMLVDLGIEYHLVNTSMSVERILGDLLAGRTAARRRS